MSKVKQWAWDEAENKVDNIIAKLTSGERENVEVKGAKTYVVREGFKAPDGVWNPDSEIATAFSNNLDFFPNTFRPQEVDKNENGKVDP